MFKNRKHQILVELFVSVNSSRQYEPIKKMAEDELGKFQHSEKTGFQQEGHGPRDLCDPNLCREERGGGKWQHFNKARVF